MRTHQRELPQKIQDNISTMLQVYAKLKNHALVLLLVI